MLQSFTPIHMRTRGQLVKIKNEWPKIALLITLFVLCIILVAMQIQGAETATKLESGLLSGLQFLISLAFSWVLAFWVFELGYKDKQKKFALGAFRRIKEIERNLVRTSKYLDDAMRNEDDLRPCLGVVRANLTNAKETVFSSIYDWSDIIEDEIAISAQIEKLERSISFSDGSTQTKDNTSQEIEKLSQQLPPSLRQAIGVENTQTETERAVDYLRSEIRENGNLDLTGFWEAKDSFMKDTSNLKPGDSVYIARGITKNRIGAILAYDADGNSFGVIGNRCAPLQATYDVFANALDKVFGGTLRPKLFGGNPIEAVVKEVVNTGHRENSSRKYFEVSINKDQLDRLV
jgi:hypothetical protein